MTTTAAVIITVETAGATAFLSLANSFNLLFCILFFSFYIETKMGITLAANTEIITSIDACLNPAAIDSSLIFPATIPIR